jgi:eukaryotic-like serine/threonine-protein kinase
MPLAISASDGPYQIVAPLGSGGMGDVYRARDTRLNRSVAIKVLREHLAADSERRTRFEREAHVLSRLNHPHICTLYDIGEHEGATYLVLELVDGQTLTDRLERLRPRPLPLKEALAIAIDIAEALDAAHRRGIVHRDLKPSNVMLTEAGAKLLDFGIAKAKDAFFPPGPDGSDGLPCGTVTVEGAILGTIHYMAPEQLEGRDTDGRSDIFSFGAVLYEMLTGQPAFDGESQSKVIAALLDHEPPPVSARQPLASPALAHTVQKCLAKDPEKRWQSSSDLADELKWVRDIGREAAAVTTAPRSLRRRVMPVALGVLLTGVLASAAWWGLRSDGFPKTVSRFTVPLGEGHRFASAHQLVALSPDGTRMVYAADTGLYVRSMSELAAIPLSPAEVPAGAASPAFSPDGRWIVFYSGWGELKKVAVDGGAPITLCAMGIPFGISWSDSGILFGQGYPGSEPRGILRISPEGGKPEVLIASKNDEVATAPQMLPDSDTLLFTLLTGDSQDRWDRASIVAQSLKSGKRTTLVEGGSDGRYLPSGHILYARGGVLHAVPFDARHLRVTGGPVPVLEGVNRSGADGTASWSLANNGTLLYARGPAPSTDQRGLALSNKEGVLEPLKVPPGPYLGPRVSPDAKWVAATLDDGKESDIWLYDVTGTTAGRRLTYGGKNRFAVWTPDGRRLVYQSDREGDQGLFWQPADGTGAGERLTKAEPHTFHVAESFSRDGNHLLVRVTTPSKRFVMTLTIKDKRLVPFLDEGGFSAFSPDGKWVAYTHREGRSFPVNVAPFPPTGATYQIWADGTQSAWSPDGKELYTAVRGRFEGVNITTQPTIAFGRPHSVPFLGYGIGPLVKNYDVLPDGRFLILTNPTGRDALPQIQVVLNWADELKRRLNER